MAAAGSHVEIETIERLGSRQASESADGQGLNLGSEDAAKACSIPPSSLSRSPPALLAPRRRRRAHCQRTAACHERTLRSRLRLQTRRSPRPAPPRPAQAVARDRVHRTEPRQRASHQGWFAASPLLSLVLSAHARTPVEQQTALGQTLLPQTLTSLLKSALNDRDSSSCKAAIFELLRVSANLCMDHGESS